MPLSERLYKPNQAILKKYGNKYKLTVFRNLRTAGLEVDDQEKTERGTVNDEKLESNISRARSMIHEYAVCNDWEYFCTFTIDGKKYPRTELEKYHKDMAQFIRNYNKKHGTGMQYLLIPEQHKKGGWHEHGLIKGIPEDALREFTLKEKLPHYIRDKLKQGQKVYEWPDYREKFGFCDLEPVRNPEAVAKYVTKYITKELTSSIKKLNAHMYYCSQGLETATEIKRGTMLQHIVPDWQNDYLMIKEYAGDIPQEVLEMMID